MQSQYLMEFSIFVPIIEGNSGRIQFLIRIALNRDIVADVITITH